MYFKIYRSPKWLGAIFPALRWSKPNNNNEAYLTFDDGPCPGVTDNILDLLKSHNAKATFFCVGANIERYPEIFQRIKEEGHAIGNHTYHHLDAWRVPFEQWKKDFLKCQTLTDTNLMRPPYGHFTPRMRRWLTHRNIQIVQWSVVTYDWLGFSVEGRIKRILSNLKAGDIVVFHDQPKTRLNYKNFLELTLEHNKDLNFAALSL